jgi:hypothetical protein
MYEHRRYSGPFSSGHVIGIVIQIPTTHVRFASLRERIRSTCVETSPVWIGVRGRSRFKWNDTVSLTMLARAFERKRDTREGRRIPRDHSRLEKRRRRYADGGNPLKAS